jgi:hypothetical protein
MTKDNDSNLNLKVEIDRPVYDKVMHWVNKSNYEVSGLGIVVRDPERNVLRVTDAILLPQENTQAHTEISSEHVSKAMFDFRDAEGDLRWWWHSHVNMNVFWSGTDKETIEQISKAGWFLSTVFNQREEMRTCISQYKPYHLMVDQLQTRIVNHVPEELKQQWDAEYDEKVTNLTYPSIGSDSESEISWKRFFGDDPRVFDELADPALAPLSLDQLIKTHKTGEIDDNEFFAEWARRENILIQRAGQEKEETDAMDISNILI